MHRAVTLLKVSYDCTMYICERPRSVASKAVLHVQFCEQLRQPLCLALLRNCTSVFDEAYSAATRLFTAILLQPQAQVGTAGGKDIMPWQ